MKWEEVFSTIQRGRRTLQKRQLRYRDREPDLFESNISSSLLFYGAYLKVEANNCLYITIN